MYISNTYIYIYRERVCVCIYIYIYIIIGICTYSFVYAHLPVDELAEGQAAVRAPCYSQSAND